MGFQVSLYDALVSIAVPADKARAVADAMERDMGATLATKSDILATMNDIQLVRQELRQELAQLRQELAQLRQELAQLRQEFKMELSMELNLVRKETELLRSSMTVRLGSIQVVAAGLLFAALKLT